jgi:hypothetical protein
MLKNVVDYEANDLDARNTKETPIKGIAPSDIDLMQQDFVHIKELSSGSYQQQVSD